ncbi:hypothetical protein PENSPDRAFT_654486 [Peniophora sp. CONT]|nr:hypothetical protein PENSPDRAFT_654486 [Peniophora sp. CONT]
MPDIGRIWRYPTLRAARMSFSHAVSLSPLASVYGEGTLAQCLYCGSPVMASKHVEDVQVGHAASATPNAARVEISKAPLTTQGEAGGKMPYIIVIAGASGRSSRQARKPCARWPNA